MDEQRRYFLVKYTRHTFLTEEEGLFTCFASDGSEPSRERLTEALVKKRGWDREHNLEIDMFEFDNVREWSTVRTDLPTDCCCGGRLAMYRVTVKADNYYRNPAYCADCKCGLPYQRILIEK
jgi:hypothetical protein